MGKIIKATPIVSRRDARERAFARWASGEDEAYSKFLQKGGYTVLTFPRQSWYAHLEQEKKSSDKFNIVLLVLVVLGFVAYHMLFTGGHF